MNDIPSPKPSAGIPGVVLAGGRSSRMGSDKAFVRLGGRLLVEHAINRLRPQVSALAINANARSAELASLGLSPPMPVFADPDETRPGPLGGILAALLHARRHWPDASHVATVPTDSPFFPPDLVARLRATPAGPGQAVVAASSGGLHPVFALWPVVLADDLATWLRTGQSLRLRAWLERHDARTVDFPDLQTRAGPLDPFFNINTPEDLASAGTWLAALEPQDTRK